MTPFQFTHVVDGAKVRVVHRRHCASFAIEPLDRRFRFHPSAAKIRNLNRHFALQLRIVTEIDSPHATSAQ